MITKQYGPWALIAGGSEGVAASFAHKLAGLGMNLVLVARRSEPLEKLGQEIKGQTGTKFGPFMVLLRENSNSEQPVRRGPDDGTSICALHQYRDVSGIAWQRFQRHAERRGIALPGSDTAERSDDIELVQFLA